MQQLENLLLWIWKHGQPDTVLSTSLVTNAHKNSQATVGRAFLHLYLYLGCLNLGTCSLETVSQTTDKHMWWMRVYTRTWVDLYFHIHRF